MIYDSIKNSKLYSGLGPGFREAFDFFISTKFEKTPPCRYDLKDGIYYMVQNYETKPEAEGFFETHRKYIDLQCVVSGRERHDFTHFSTLKQRDPYDTEKDMVIYDGKGNSLILEAGYFVIYYPDDAHMPNIRAGKEPQKMIKVVLKIPVKN